MSISVRGYDVGVYPHVNPGCYKLLWSLIDKVHISSHDLYVPAIKSGLKHHVPHQFISYALDLDAFPERKVKTQNLKIEILTVGRLHWKKGFEYALYAIQKLIHNKFPVHYTIVGAGSHKDAILFAIDQLGLHDHVTLRGIVEYHEVLNLMNQSNIYLQTSVQEGFCCAVLEAQALGLLVIATDAEGINENIENEKSGWIVERRNIEEIYNKLIEVINLSEFKKDGVVNYARKRIESNFNLHHRVKSWEQFFN